MSKNQPADGVLVNARLEYLYQLTDACGPYIVNHINELWVESKRRVRAFQEALQGIPRYNSAAFETHTCAIVARAPYLDKLIAAVLIATVKLLASIKVGDGEEQVRLKLPTNEAFLSKVFVKTARIFYESPELIREPYAQKILAVQIAIEKAIRDMLPLADLLTSYTADGAGAAEAEAEAEAEVEPEPEPEPEPEAEEDEDEEAEAEAEENEGETEAPEEEKRVSFGQAQQPPVAPAAAPAPAYIDATTPIPAIAPQAPQAAYAPQTQFVPQAPQAQAPPLPLPAQQAYAQPPQLRADAEEKIDW